MAPHFRITPSASLEYFRLAEDGYSESGGGDAMDLTVAARTSQALTANATLTAAWSFGRDPTPQYRPLTIELEGGRRQHLSGNLGTTVASFTDGESFALTPDALKGGWIGEARLQAGGLDFSWRLSGRAEKSASGTVYSGRASFGFAF